MYGARFAITYSDQVRFSFIGILWIGSDQLNLVESPATAKSLYLPNCILVAAILDSSVDEAEL